MLPLRHPRQLSLVQSRLVLLVGKMQWLLHVRSACLVLAVLLVVVMFWRQCLRVLFLLQLVVFGVLSSLRLVFVRLLVWLP